MSTTAKPAGRIGIGLFLLLVLAALAGAGWLAVSNLQFKNGAVRAEGMVVKLERRTSTTARRRNQPERTTVTWAPVFEFRNGDGETNRVTRSSSSSHAAYKVGEKVPILYAPKNPQGAKIDSFATLWMGPTILGGRGLFFSAFGGIALMRRIRRR